MKIFLNGDSLNVGRSGRTAFFFDDLPLKNVKKIEIMRGPGSALYGTNTFLAVINVITKGVDDIENFDNNRFSFEVGFEWNKQDNIDWSTNFDVETGVFIGPVQDQGDVLWVGEYIKTGGIFTYRTNGT